MFRTKSEEKKLKKHPATLKKFRIKNHVFRVKIRKKQRNLKFLDISGNIFGFLMLKNLGVPNFSAVASIELDL